MDKVISYQNNWIVRSKEEEWSNESSKKWDNEAWSSSQLSKEASLVVLSGLIKIKLYKV